MMGTHCEAGIAASSSGHCCRVKYAKPRMRQTNPGLRIERFDDAHGIYAGTSSAIRRAARHVRIDAVPAAPGEFHLSVMKG